MALHQTTCPCHRPTSLLYGRLLHQGVDGESESATLQATCAQLSPLKQSNYQAFPRTFFLQVKVKGLMWLLAGDAPPALLLLYLDPGLIFYVGGHEALHQGAQMCSLEWRPLVPLRTLPLLLVLIVLIWMP